MAEVEARQIEARRRMLHLSRTDVVMTILSGAVEALLIWKYVGKRWGFHD